MKPPHEQHEVVDEPCTARERAFTMIELLIVMVVIAIIAAIAVPTFFGARTTATKSEFISVARSYVVAIEGFRLDNGGQAPVMNTPAWPNTALARGPINTMPGLPDAKRSYMRSGVPAAMRDGSATISTADRGAKQHIQYVVGADGSSYSLVVSIGTERCVIGTTRPGLKSC